MSWYNSTAKIPLTSTKFIRIIDGFVFSCPSSIRHAETDKDAIDKKKKKAVYQPVSVRMCSFRQRGIDSNLLTTVLSQIRKPLVAQNTYAVLKDDESVPSKIADIIANVSLADPYHDILVYQSRSDMSDAEAIYYYIRNSFAHGSFEVIIDHGKRIYLLQSDKGDTVKAQMRLKETTLERILHLATLSATDLKSLQRIKRRR